MIIKFSIPNGAKYFSSGIFQNYLAFIPDTKNIKCFKDTTCISSWKSDGMSKENVENITKLDIRHNFASTFVDHHFLPDINFYGHCLIKKKKKISVGKKVINLYISYTLGGRLRNLNTGFTFGNYCLLDL